MAVSNTKLLDLLGKQVSFSWLRHDGVTCHSDGQLMSVVFSFDSLPQIAIDDHDFITIDQILAFRVLDGDLTIDLPFTGALRED